MRIHVSRCVRYVRTQRNIRIREREREEEERREVQCNSQAVLDIREARILGRIDWGGGADSRGKMTVVLRTWILASNLSYLGSSSPYYTRNGPNPFGQVCLHPSSIGRVARLGTLKPAKDKTDNWLGMDSDFADL